MLSKATKRDLRSLQGRGHTSLAKIILKGHLPAFGDPGEVPQQRRRGYQPIGENRPVPGTPRKEGRDASRRWKAEDRGRGRSSGRDSRD